MPQKKFVDTKIDALRLRGMSLRCESFRMIDNTKMRERCLSDVGHSEKHKAASGTEWDDE